MVKIINLFIRVIDNLGDIGFAGELIRAFQEQYPDRYFFDIWSDDVAKTEKFFSANSELARISEIKNITEIDTKRGTISLLLFHHPIPKGYRESAQELFLRIDYLSFSSDWTRHHGVEHIDSHTSRKIIEIIPSPLPEGAGIILPPHNLISRNILAQRFGLDMKKKWITFFCYDTTWENRIQIENIENTELIVLGRHAHKIPSSEQKFISLPFLSLLEFSSIIGESSWTVIRGEVSFTTTLQLGTPFLWDMYKEIGGFHHEQADDFLTWYEADIRYRDFFDRLNGIKEGSIRISEVNSYFEIHSKKPTTKSANLVEELQKYIDKYHFSL